MPKEYLDWSVSDKVQLVEELLVSIQRDTNSTLSAAQKKFIDERESLARNPTVKKLSWSEVKSGIKRK